MESHATMNSAPKVQLYFKDRLVSEVAFSGEALRIGRMKENDLIVNNLAVSRFHAVLRRSDAGFEIEDLKSENGTFVNGVRVDGTLAVSLGDRVQIGKHCLVIGECTARPVAAPAPSASDAWDAAQTYYGLAPPSPKAPKAAASPSDEAGEELLLSEALEDEDTGGAIDGGAAVLLSVPAEPDDLLSAAGELDDAPDPGGAFAFGEEDLFPEADALPADAVESEDAWPVVAADLDDPVDDLLDPVTDPLAPAPSGEHTALFEFGTPGNDLGTSDPSLRRAALTPAAPPVAAPSPAPAEYAGLLVQRGGRLVSVCAWEGPEVLVGRAGECQLVLGHAGVSRKHAAFVRDGASYEVRDLDSVNGLSVNGTRVQRQRLQVGDVVRIEDFDITFVLDSQPIAEGVLAPKPAQADEDADPGHHTQLGGMPLGAPTGYAQQDLLTTDDEFESEEKPDAALTAHAIAPKRATAPPLPALAERIQLEIELAVDQLPLALRTALETLAQDGEALVPVTLRVRVR